MGFFSCSASEGDGPDSEFATILISAHDISKWVWNISTGLWRSMSIFCGDCPRSRCHVMLLGRHHFQTRLPPPELVTTAHVVFLVVVAKMSISSIEMSALQGCCTYADVILHRWPPHLDKKPFEQAWVIDRGNAPDADETFKDSVRVRSIACRKLDR